MAADYRQMLEPLDEYNQKLQANVHPTDWENPTPQGRYNLVVLGAGTAGLVAAAGAAGLGAKVALIERSLMGGDCLNVGCVPSKALLASAHAVGAIRRSRELGVHVGAPEVDFPQVMARMRKLRSEISPHDSADRFRSLGIDVYLGDATFSGPSSVQVAGQQLEFSKAVIATGGRADAPNIEGYAEIEPLTNESIFSLTELPESLVVVGGGPIGVEMAQTFCQFGSKVTLLEASDHILSREDPDAALIVQQRLIEEGVRVVTNARVESFHTASDGNRETTYRESKQAGNEVSTQVVSSQVLMAIGRTPNVSGLGLEAAGVEYDLRQGVFVNDRLQSTNARVFAAGDVASKYKFTHAADFMARAVIQNALFAGRKKMSGMVIPWATYTSPELAQVGLTAAGAAEAGIDIDTYTQEFSKLDRAILEGDTLGFARVHVRRGTDKIVGGTIVGQGAGDMISTISMAMTSGVGLAKISATISPYPTRAEAIRKLGDQYNKTRFTPTVARLFSTWLKWRR